MAGHLLSAPVSRFHIIDSTDVEPAHFFSQGPLVNAWCQELANKYRLGVCPAIVRVPHLCITDVEPAHSLEPGSTYEWCQKLAIDYKACFDTSVPWPDTYCLRQFPGSTSLTAPMWIRPTSGARVHL